MPSAREALCAWALGLAWTAACLWLAAESRTLALPILLLVGVLAMWGWSYLTWITLLPGVLVLAAVTQPFVPFSFRVGSEPVGIPGTLALAMLMIATMRAVALRRRLFPATPIDGPLLALVGLIGLAALAEPMRAAALHLLGMLFIGLVGFYASTVAASAPGGARRLWSVFPLAAAVIATAATLQASGIVALQQWDSGRTPMLPALLIGVPPALGLALDAGRHRARLLWGIGAAIGMAGVLLLAKGGLGVPDVHSSFVLGKPMGFARAAVVWSMLFGLVVLAWRVRRDRPRERARWTGLAAAFVTSVALELVGWPIDTLPQVVLLSAGAGLVVGTSRVAARRSRAAVESPGSCRTKHVADAAHREAA